ncbi:MAG: porin [Thiohalocapsa sp. PB-PSB1]|nr:MAG: hypothetical protein N838_01890 [Thiohalocapsa sp. PB-PSB1]QQO57080.1 MAG: porin [Thiohalocapsa sp. PB-PSB1]
MNKKLITLAVAAAVAAPAAAMAEATLYGRLGVSLDYEDVKNAIPPAYLREPVVIKPGTPIGVDADGSVVYDVNDPRDPRIQERGVVIDSFGRPITIQQGQDFKGWGVNQQGSEMRGEGPSNRIGVKGSEDLGNGLKAIYQVELGVKLAAADDNIPSGRNDGVSIRNSFVGLAGGFGTVLIGRHDTPLKISTGKLDLFADTMADYNGTVDFDDLRVDNTFVYISPSFSGFSLAAALVAPGGATAGFGQNYNSDEINGAWSIAGIYNNGPFYASAAYETLSNEMFMNSETSLAGEAACFDQNPDGTFIVDSNGVRRPTRSCNYVGDDYNKYRFGLGLLDWNGFTLTAIYENQDNLPLSQTRSSITYINDKGEIIPGSIQNGFQSQDLWQIQAGYAFGNNMFKAMYGSADRGDQRFAANLRNTTIAANNVGAIVDNLGRDLAGDKSTWAVGFDHNFSKRTKAYMLYTNVDDDREDLPLSFDQSWSGFSIGMVHKF